MRPLRPALRDWLVVAIALLLVGTYWVVWVGYVKVHTVTRYVASEPGGIWVHDGQTLQVVSLVRTQTLKSEYASSEPQVAPAGAEFVVATLNYGTDHDVDYGDCGPSLIGPQGQVWEEILPDVSRPAESSCSDLKAGARVQVEVIYEIPSRFGDQLRGLALDDPAKIDRVPVLTPPR